MKPVYQAKQIEHAWGLLYPPRKVKLKLFETFCLLDIREFPLA
jgi:hypothetical protein